MFYPWVVFLHVTVIFIFLIQHGAEIFATFRLREQKEPEGVFATYSFMPNNNSRNLRITYSLIIVTGAVAGFMSTWWKQGWMWAALGMMILIWIAMHHFGGNYLTAVDAITEQALKNKNDEAAIERFRQGLKSRREPEIMTITSVVGMLIILWLMMFKPF
jgi:hypothetical protein